MPNIFRVMFSENHSNQSGSSSGGKSQNREIGGNLNLKVIPVFFFKWVHRWTIILTSKRIYQIGLENEEVLAHH